MLMPAVCQSPLQIDNAFLAHCLKLRVAAQGRLEGRPFTFNPGTKESPWPTSHAPHYRNRQRNVHASRNSGRRQHAGWRPNARRPRQARGARGRKTRISRGFGQGRSRCRPSGIFDGERKGCARVAFSVPEQGARAETYQLILHHWIAAFPALAMHRRLSSNLRFCFRRPGNSLP